jgi:hypothetical protein
MQAAPQEESLQAPRFMMLAVLRRRGRLGARAQQAMPVVVFSSASPRPFADRIRVPAKG